MRELIEQYYLPRKTGRKRMPVIYNAVGKRDLFFVAQTDILRWTSQLLSEGELVRKKQFFCIASNSTRNSLIVLFYPIH